jgi:hypothetical protein
VQDLSAGGQRGIGKKEQQGAEDGDRTHEVFGFHIQRPDCAASKLVAENRLILAIGRTTSAARAFVEGKRRGVKAKEGGAICDLRYTIYDRMGELSFVL